MTPAELTALEAELRYTAAARAMRHSATTPTGYVEYRAADAIAEQLRENADLRRKLDTAREVIAFYADRNHWRTANPDGPLGSGGRFGLGYHQTGDGIMEVQGAHCGFWVEHPRRGNWQSDAGHKARRWLEGK